MGDGVDMKKEFHELFGGDHKDGCGVCGKIKVGVGGWTLAISPSGVIEMCPTCRYNHAMPVKWIKEAVSHGKEALLNGANVFVDGKYVPYQDSVKP